MVDFELRRKRKQHVLYKTIFIVGGLFFSVPGIVKIIYRDTFIFDTDFFISAFNILVGLAWILHGLNIINVSVHSSLKIDDNRLYFNPSSFEKTVSILWDEIKSVEIKVNKLIVHLKDYEQKEINLAWIPHKELKRIKDETEKLTKEKGILSSRI